MVVMYCSNWYFPSLFRGRDSHLAGGRPRGKGRPGHRWWRPCQGAHGTADTSGYEIRKLYCIYLYINVFYFDVFCIPVYYCHTAEFLEFGLWAFSPMHMEADCNALSGARLPNPMPGRIDCRSHPPSFACSQMLRLQSIDVRSPFLSLYLTMLLYFQQQQCTWSHLHLLQVFLGNVPHNAGHSMM